uniref:Dynein regulatory complex subunit 3 n=1 Tax=Dicentrarchus labrax TaxID=13489 RepID=A0A8P4K0A3_DICLA
MTVYLGKCEPILMDEKFLKAAVEEQVSATQDGLVAKAEGIHFSCLFTGILRIDHLWEFTSLARLDLNNNHIEVIEGLDRLVNLTWLNLSFNIIEKIEGLESLRKLEVLNLSNNRISVIENLDTLENLSHFCFANNLLEKLDNVLYLRKFKNLFTLNLFGNPFPEEDDYKSFVAVYFPKLTCLDYRLIDEKIVSTDQQPR